MSRLASAVEPIGWSIRVCTIANSSPPRRATVSVGRTHARMRSRDRLQQRVADRMAERVVHGLEVIEIEAEHGDSLAARARGSSALFHLLAKANPVRQVA